MVKPTSKELLEFENQNHSSICDQSNLLICKNDSPIRRRHGKRLANDLIDGGGVLEKPNITLVPKSGVLGKVKDFLGVMDEANKKLQVGGNPSSSSYDIKAIPLSGLENIRVEDSSIGIDDDDVDDESEEYIEMDLFLGVADLRTPEAVAAAEAAVGSPMLSVANTDIIKKEKKKSNQASNEKRKKTPKIVVLD
ncbi:hypothetical protein ZOSMA_226G00270 [Zostera marina]|uniref:Uncharacterized protein n=1 Tax=Zostera marina TaxID=29655 RepID=A0A0K9PKZ6_ZOSMR|nr:hypothetical protein ZOSMA_226G00270 [Zostera marina]